MRRPARLIGCVVLGVVALVGCGDDRPSTTEWATIWSSERERMPTADALLAGGEQRCDQLVGELRDVRDALEPAPTEALDAAVDAWLDHAEGIAFDCPTDPALLEGRYDELAVLGAEVDAGLAAEP